MELGICAVDRDLAPIAHGRIPRLAHPTHQFPREVRMRPDQPDLFLQGSRLDDPAHRGHQCGPVLKGSPRKGLPRNPDGMLVDTAERFEEAVLRKSIDLGNCDHIETAVNSGQSAPRLLPRKILKSYDCSSFLAFRTTATCLLGISLPPSNSNRTNANRLPHRPCHRGRHTTPDPLDSNSPGPRNRFIFSKKSELNRSGASDRVLLNSSPPSCSLFQVSPGSERTRARCDIGCDHQPPHSARRSGTRRWRTSFRPRLCRFCMLPLRSLGETAPASHDRESATRKPSQ